MNSDSSGSMRGVQEDSSEYFLGAQRQCKRRAKCHWQALVAILMSLGF